MRIFKFWELNRRRFCAIIITTEIPPSQLTVSFFFTITKFNYNEFILVLTISLCWNFTVYECGEPLLGMDRGKPKNSERNLFQCHFSHHNSHMD
jgi:hypothetical protein